MSSEYYLNRLTNVRQGGIVYPVSNCSIVDFAYRRRPMRGNYLLAGLACVLMSLTSLAGTNVDQARTRTIWRGHISQLPNVTIWDPEGQLIHQGPHPNLTNFQVGTRMRVYYDNDPEYDSRMKDLVINGYLIPIDMRSGKHREVRGLSEHPKVQGPKGLDMPISSRIVFPTSDLCPIPPPRRPDTPPAKATNLE